MLEELFLNKDLSLLAKEKGFDEPCFGKYINGEFELMEKPDTNKGMIISITAPLYQQIIDWFETKGISVEVLHTFMGGWRFSLKNINREGTELVRKKLLKVYHKELEPTDFNETFKSKKEALNKAIEEAFKLI